MKIVLITLLSLVGVGVIIFIVGKTLPIKHIASREVELQFPLDKIWPVISNFKNSAAWRTDLKSVMKIELSNGVIGWKETTNDGDSLTYTTLEIIPEKKLVRKIIDEGLPFGGRWEFELVRLENSSKLKITEYGEVYSPIFRFMSHFIFGHYSSMDLYIKQLQNHLEKQ